MKMLRLLIALLSLVAATAACETAKSSNPLSPSVAGPIPGVDITAPLALDPPANAQVDSTKQPLTLLLENASSSGVRPLTYTVEVATDANFTNIVFVREGITPGEGGRTSLRLPDPLASGRTYYWRSRAQDGANTGPYSAVASFNVFTPVVIGEPVARAPIGDAVLGDTSPTFTVGSAPRSGPAGSITYTIELAEDFNFTRKSAIWQFGERGNETVFEPPIALAYGRQYFWHVRGAEATATGPWSAPASFRTPAPPPAPPSDGGGGGGGGNACGAPYPTTPQSIVRCQRSKFGHMSSSQIVTFLRATARDLNRNGIANGPFGLLRKKSGNQCNGYSCDIVCSGQGNSQKQWDVLSDSDGSQGAVWIGPKEYPGIRVDVCEIQ